MSIPITVREETEADFVDPYLHDDESLWLPVDQAARDCVHLRHLWRDIVVLFDTREATTDPLTRAVLGRYLLLEVCAAEEFLGPIGRHAENAARRESIEPFKEAMREFRRAFEPLAKEMREARNTFVAHREPMNKGESRLDETRRLRRFVALPDDPRFRVILDALHRVVSAVRGLAVGEYSRTRIDPTTGRVVTGRLSPIRLR